MNKLKIITGIFKTDIKQVAYNNNYLLFGLPLIASNLEDLKLLMNDIKYKIYNVQFCGLATRNKVTSILFNKLHTIRIVNSNANIKLENVSVRHHEPIQTPLAPAPAPSRLQVPCRPQNTNTTANENKTIVFKIKPDIQNDIYNLYCVENNVETFYNIAYIPDYKTSVMMNKLFRNIKENDNLDLLEESDDEDEFQNESADRFVDIEKSLLMICKYNYKFKKWYPVKVFDNMARETNNVIVDRNVLVGCEQYTKNTKNNYATKNYKNNYQNNYQNKKYNKYQNKIYSIYMSSGSDNSNFGYGGMNPYGSNVNSAFVNKWSSNNPANFGSNEVPGLPGLAGAKNSVDAAAGIVPGIAIYKGGYKKLKRKIKNITRKYKRNMGMKGGKKYVRSIKSKIKAKYASASRGRARTMGRSRSMSRMSAGFRRKRSHRRRKQRGGYSQYQNNLPMTPTYSVGGVLPASQLALANPPPIQVLSNCTSCRDNYNHFDNTSFASPGH